MSHVTVWEARTASSFAYVELSKEVAMSLVRMAEGNPDFLIADASDDIAPLIHPRIRTSWFTRNLPPEEGENVIIHTKDFGGTRE